MSSFISPWQWVSRVTLSADPADRYVVSDHNTCIYDPSTGVLESIGGLNEGTHDYVEFAGHGSLAAGLYGVATVPGQQAVSLRRFNSYRAPWTEVGAQVAHWPYGGSHQVGARLFVWPDGELGLYAGTSVHYWDGGAWTPVQAFSSSGFPVVALPNVSSYPYAAAVGGGKVMVGTRGRVHWGDRAGIYEILRVGQGTPDTTDDVLEVQYHEGWFYVRAKSTTGFWFPSPGTTETRDFGAVIRVAADNSAVENLWDGAGIQPQFASHGLQYGSNAFAARNMLVVNSPTDVVCGGGATAADDLDVMAWDGASWTVMTGSADIGGTQLFSLGGGEYRAPQTVAASYEVSTYDGAIWTSEYTSFDHPTQSTPAGGYQAWRRVTGSYGT